MSELDLSVPGLAGRFLRGSDERRQVIAAYLSTLPFARRRRPILPDSAAARFEIAKLLNRGNHNDILWKAFGKIPEGFRGVLARSGSFSQPACYYRLLKHLLSNEHHKHLARAVRHLKSVDLTRVVVGYILPADLVHPNLLEHLHGVAEARDVANSIKILRGRALDNKAFQNGLRSLRRRGDVREYCETWILRCAFAPSPIPASDQYCPIADGEILKVKALEYRNCSRSYAIDLLEGSASLGEFIVEDGSAMVLLVKKDEEWLLTKFTGTRIVRSTKLFAREPSTTSGCRGLLSDALQSARIRRTRRCGVCCREGDGSEK